MTPATRLLTRRQVAEMLGVKEQTLAAWACRGAGGPPYVKLGGAVRGAVRYRAGDIEAWLQTRTVGTTGAGE